MYFSEALKMLLAGHKLKRIGWHGMGMYVIYRKGYPEGIAINKSTAEATGMPEGRICKFLPYLMMKTVEHAFVPWTITQADVLAADWEVVK